MNTSVPKPPRAEKRPRVETWHGYEKRDDYHWLKAENWQEVMHDPSLLPPEIRAFLEGENAYHEAVMADTKALQDKLFAELKGRIKEDDSSVPAPEGAYDYYASYVKGGQHPRYCRRPRGSEGPEELLLDGNELAKGREYFRFGGTDLSPDHKLIAWSFDGNGSEFYELRVRDTATRRGHGGRSREHRGRGRLGRGRQELLLYAAGREPPAAEDLPPRARHAAGGRRADLRGAGHRHVHRCRASPIQRNGS